METKLIETMFERMGARAKIHEAERIRVNRFFSREPVGGIDIKTDNHGEYFDVSIMPGDSVEYEVIDVRPSLRHLLLLARRDNRKEKFLCGHDERHWFVCAVPGNSVSNVESAMVALQPTEVRGAVTALVKRHKNRLRRRNEAFVRQGEWFFVPAPELVVDPKLVLKNEPISRGGGSKPHMCQFLYRTGGQVVYVSTSRPKGVTLAELNELIHSRPGAEKWGWTEMRRDALAYVRGRVWHADHKTIVLDGWHRVLMNTERLAPGAREVVFLD